jgi:outer membrane autotransporter protein
MSARCVRNKAVLTLAVLFTIFSGRTYAASIDATGGTVNIQGTGDISFSPSDGGGTAIYARNGAVVTVGSTGNITTSGEVIATNGSGSEASTITLTAGNITLNYNPNLYKSTNGDKNEDHTVYVSGGSDITVDAGGTVTIVGPVGAADTGSNITIDGSDISVTHNTVAHGADYSLETRGIHVENGGSVQIGSDDTDTLNVEVANGSSHHTYENKSSIQIKGSESSLALYGKNISVTAEDGVINGYYADGGSLIIGSDATESVTVNGPTATHRDGASTIINASKEITLDNFAVDGHGFAQIGNTATESVSLTGAVWAFGGPEVTVLGKSITIERDPNLVFNGAYSRFRSSVSIGSDETNDVYISVAITEDDSTLTILGNDITIGNGYASLFADYSSQLVVGDTSTASGTFDGWIAAEASGDGDETAVISVTADEITAKSAVLSSGPHSSVTLDGKNIFQTYTDDWEVEEGGPFIAPSYVSAVFGGFLTIGTSRTDTVYVADKVEAYNYPIEEGYYASSVTMDGASITVDKGVVADGVDTNVTIGGAGVTQTLTSDLTAKYHGVVVATLSGAYTGDALAYGGPWKQDESYIIPGGTLTLTAGSATGNLTSTGTGSTLTATLSGALTGNATAEDSGTLTLTAGSVTGDLATSESGVLTATVASLFTGMTADDADTMTLNLNSGATWNLTDSSTVSTLNADGAHVNLIDGTLGQTLTTDSFAGSGATVYLDADGSTNTGNDHLYVTGTHTGTTALHLSSTSNTWENALGTVLASVGDEQGSFVSDGETEAALYYYDLELASTTDNVTDGYNTDWYLAAVKKEATNSEGHHTTVVRNLGGITGGNYLLWRSDMDTLFRRLGEADGTLTSNTDNGIWARAKGKKFSRISDFLVDTKYNEYEVGYDWLHDKTDTKEHVMGVGFAYLDGDATYVSGKGDIKGYTLGLYDTQVWKDGQYLDLTLKGSRYENEFNYEALSRNIDGQSNSTGFSLGAEYGYKKKFTSGWFVEPQAQLAVGIFSNDSFTDSNGVHVDGETIHTALGRIGARAGYESPKFSVYAKANWYHDFGGNHITNMSVDTDSLRVHEDYGDTWFSYGLGAAYKINDRTQAYFDLERGDGSSYDENWSWDVGLRFSF